MIDETNVNAFPEDATAREQAAYWVTLRDRAGLSEKDEAAFQVWMARAPENADIYDEVYKHWQDLEGLASLAGFTVPPEFDASSNVAAAPAPSPQTIQPSRFSWTAPAAIAASLLVVVSSIFVVFSDRSASPIENGSFQTAIGDQQSITLQDGSIVTLNTLSAVEIDYSPDARTVRLISGEAHFDVTSDAARPFSVIAGDDIVRAVGTAFTVQLHEEKLEVVVSEGRVALIAPTPDDAESGQNATESLAGDVILEIAEGDNVTLSDDGVETVAPLSVAELNRRLSWRRGMLSFKGEHLSEVITEVSRYTEFTIEIGDESIERLPIGGYFHIGEVDELLLAIESSFDIKIERLADDHVRLLNAS